MMSGVFDSLYAEWYTDEPLLHPPAPPMIPHGYQQLTLSNMPSPDPANISLPSSQSSSNVSSSQQSQSSQYYDAEDRSSLPPFPPSPSPTDDEWASSLPPLPSSDDSCSSSSPSSQSSSSTFALALRTRLPSSQESALPSPPPTPVSHPPIEPPLRLPSIDSHAIEIASHLPAPPRRAGGRLLVQQDRLPQEVCMMVLCLLSPREAFKARLVSKSWHAYFWDVLVRRRWLPHVSIFIRSHTSWIFEESSVATHGGLRFRCKERDVKLMDAGDGLVETVAYFRPRPTPTSAQLTKLTLDLRNKCQIIVKFHGRRYWDFKIDSLNYKWGTQELYMDVKCLFGAILGRPEGEWPGATQFPRVVWYAPPNREGGGTLGRWEMVPAR